MGTVSDRTACSAAELGVQCHETDELILLFASSAMADSQPQHLESLQLRQGLAPAEVTGSNVVWAREEREDKACKDMVSAFWTHQTQELVFMSHEVECCEAVTALAVSSCSCGGAGPAAALHVTSHVPGRCSVAKTPGLSRRLLLPLMRPQCSCVPHRGHSSDQDWLAESTLSWRFRAASVWSCRGAWRVRERHTEIHAPCKTCESVRSAPAGDNAVELWAYGKAPPASCAGPYRYSGCRFDSAPGRPLRGWVGHIGAVCCMSCRNSA